MKKKKGFTLVELLAVIAILASILLIAVPMILGVIEDAKVKSFKLSVLGAFDAIELEYARKGTTSGNLSDLQVSNNTFLTGTWSLEEGTGNITMVDVSDGVYEVEAVTNQDGEEFEVTKNGVSTSIQINGDNPVVVNCSKTETYTDEGAKYESTNLTTTDTVDLTKAGTYQLRYNHGRYSATRIVTVKNDHTPTITLTQEEVTFYKGDSFNSSNYVESASDPCEGDITSKVQSTSNVLTDVPGTYEVVYKVKNLGEKEESKTLIVTVNELPTVELVMPSADGENGWYKTSQTITVNYDNTILDSYEYAISTDNGTTYGTYQSPSSNNFPLNENSGMIKIKARGKRGEKYTNLTTSDVIKMDTKTPELTMSASEKLDVSSSNTFADVVFGASNGKTTCINLDINNNEVTTIKDVRAFGTYRISCTATSNAGLSSSKTVSYSFDGTLMRGSFMSCNRTDGRGCENSTTGYVLTSGTIQFGPYFKIQAGCYRVTYTGSNFSTSCVNLSTYQHEPRIYVSRLSLTTTPTQMQYYINLTQPLMDTGIEFTSSGHCDDNPPIVDSIRVEIMTSCPVS